MSDSWEAKERAAAAMLAKDSDEEDCAISALRMLGCEIVDMSEHSTTLKQLAPAPVVEPGAVKERAAVGPQVRDWLAGLQLEHLTELFEEKGYTDVEAIKEMGLDDEDMLFLGISDEREQTLLTGKHAAGSSMSELD